MFSLLKTVTLHIFLLSQLLALRCGRGKATHAAVSVGAFSSPAQADAFIEAKASEFTTLAEPVRQTFRMAAPSKRAEVLETFSQTLKATGQLPADPIQAKEALARLQHGLPSGKTEGGLATLYGFSKLAEATKKARSNPPAQAPSNLAAFDSPSPGAISPDTNHKIVISGNAAGQGQLPKPEEDARALWRNAVRQYAPGRGRCQNCGQYASVIAESGSTHTCPATATAATMERNVRRKLGLPQGCYTDPVTGHNLMEDLVRQAGLAASSMSGEPGVGNYGLISLRHSATGQIIEATLDGTILALKQGYQPLSSSKASLSQLTKSRSATLTAGKKGVEGGGVEELPPALTQVVSRSGAVVWVVDPKGLPAPTEPTTAFEAAALASGLDPKAYLATSTAAEASDVIETKVKPGSDNIVKVRVNWGARKEDAKARGPIEAWATAQGLEVEMNYDPTRTLDPNGDMTVELVDAKGNNVTGSVGEPDLETYEVFGTVIASFSSSSSSSLVAATSIKLEGGSDYDEGRFSGNEWRKGAGNIVSEPALSVAASRPIMYSGGYASAFYEVGKYYPAAPNNYATARKTGLYPTKLGTKIKAGNNLVAAAMTFSVMDDSVYPPKTDYAIRTASDGKIELHNLDTGLVAVYDPATETVGSVEEAINDKGEPSTSPLQWAVVMAAIADNPKTSLEEAFAKDVADYQNGVSNALAVSDGAYLVIRERYKAGTVFNMGNQVVGVTNCPNCGKFVGATPCPCEGRGGVGAGAGAEISPDATVPSPASVVVVEEEVDAAVEVAEPTAAILDEDEAAARPATGGRSGASETEVEEEGVDAAAVLSPSPAVAALATPVATSPIISLPVSVSPPPPGAGRPPASAAAVTTVPITDRPAVSTSTLPLPPPPTLPPEFFTASASTLSPALSPTVAEALSRMSDAIGSLARHSAEQETRMAALLDKVASKVAQSVPIRVEVANASASAASPTFSSFSPATATASISRGTRTGETVVVTYPSQEEVTTASLSELRQIPPSPERAAKDKRTGLVENLLKEVEVPGPNDPYLMAVAPEIGGQRLDPLPQYYEELDPNYELSEDARKAISTVAASLRIAWNKDPKFRPRGTQFRAFAFGGTSGSGKNMTARQIAAALAMPYYEMTINKDTSIQEEIGQTVLTSDPATGATVSRAQLGKLGQAAASGAVMCVNELVKANPGILGALQTMMEDGYIEVAGTEAGMAGGRIPVHPNTVFIGTWNPGYDGAAQRPDQALMSRMQSVIMNAPSVEEQASRLSKEMGRIFGKDAVHREKCLAASKFLADLQRMARGGSGMDREIAKDSVHPAEPTPREIARFLATAEMTGDPLLALEQFKAYADAGESFEEQWTLIKKTFTRHFGEDGQALNRKLGGAGPKTH